MTIFVDDMQRPARVGNIRAKWSHLFTDSDDQTALHEFAKMLGLKRRWFQHEDKYPHAPWLWHYDVTESVRLKAIQAGATPISYPHESGRITYARSQARKAEREIEKMIERWHEGDGAGQSLHEYLGWTWEQYKSWVETNAVPA